MNLHLVRTLHANFDAKNIYIKTPQTKQKIPYLADCVDYLE